ncbi:MFS transporter [Sinomonas humi]|uniref:Major facilitator transporter n=1 Tax=Sinomonas humi TaxID=1338436 RepID=A0A0B2APX8_9MICC|nr:MFS transporter [Sinomonas humi]KHL04007.1 major facilitator transporter [Sinomonas humi]
MTQPAGQPAQPETPSASAAASSWSPRLALLVAATYFMEFLDGTALSTALPAIGSDFHVVPADVNVAMTAYLIAVAMGIPFSSWLAERFGPRRVFCSAIAVFTIASLLCALSPNLLALTGFRALQGFGGAMMVPVGSLVVLRGTPKDQLLKATAYLVWPGLLAPVLAPLVGGAITQYLSWHWIFFVNLPLGVAAFVAALRLVPSGGADRGRRLDWPGLALTTLGVAGVVVGLELFSEGRPAGWAPAALVGGLAALAAAVVWMRRAPRPLFNFSVLHVRTFRATQTGGFVYRLTIQSVPFLLPLLFQDGFGWDPVHAGLLVAAVFVGNIGIKPATTPLIRRFGFKPVLVVAAAASAATFAGCALITPGDPDLLIALLLLVSGAFRSIGFSAYMNVQYADVSAEQLPSANAIANTLVQLAAALGVAVAALLIRAGIAFLPPGTDHAGPYRVAFAAIAVFMLVSVVDSLFLPRHAGTQVSGRRA